jgi:hypothetical protein
MASFLKIVVIALMIVVGTLIVGVWAYGLYVRGGYSKRIHKAGSKLCSLATSKPGIQPDLRHSGRLVANSSPTPISVTSSFGVI